MYFSDLYTIQKSGLLITRQFNSKEFHGKNVSCRKDSFTVILFEYFLACYYKIHYKVLELH